jgi:hypothetical protein
MPPKSAVRANGKSKASKAQPQAQPPPQPKATPADRVRLEWAGFEVWLSSQRKEVGGKKQIKLEELRQQIEFTKRTIPKGFHPTVMMGFEEKKEKVVKEIEYELVLRSRDEWDERLDKAGLKAEDWDPMTFEEQEAVKAALASDEEENESEETSENIESFPLRQNVSGFDTNCHYCSLPDRSSSRPTTSSSQVFIWMSPRFLNVPQILNVQRAYPPYRVSQICFGLKLRIECHQLPPTHQVIQHYSVTRNHSEHVTPDRF